MRGSRETRPEVRRVPESGVGWVAGPLLLASNGGIMGEQNSSNFESIV